MKVITQRTLAGTHISRACAIATKAAKSMGCIVQFDFNGAWFRATPKKSVYTLRWEYDWHATREFSRYRNSPAFKLAQEEREKRNAYDQAEINRLMGTLPGALELGMSSTLDWLAEFSSPSDNFYVEYDKGAILKFLEAVGYKAGAHVGRPKEDFTNKTVMGEYIIGQAMACLASGMPPHPITKTFVERYRALP